MLKLLDPGGHDRLGLGQAAIEHRQRRVDLGLQLGGTLGAFLTGRIGSAAAIGFTLACTIFVISFLITRVADRGAR